MHIDLHLAHEKYGDIVRFGPDRLSFRSAEGVHDIYGDRKVNVMKGGGFTDAAEAINRPVNTHSISDRSLHAKRRRLLANAFSEGALRNLEPFVIGTIREWINTIAQLQDSPADSKGWSVPRNMGVWSSNLTLDVLGELCFGKSFGAIKNGSHWASELLLGGTKFTSCIGQLPGNTWLYPILRQNWLMLRTGAKMPKQRIQYRAYMVPLLKDRFRLEEETKDKPELQRKDFMHYIMHAKDPETGEKFTPADLVGEAALLVGAGTDTTSTALAAEFFYLTRNPQILEKLQDEVRGAFDDVEDIKMGPKLSGLKYLRAVVDESLRMGNPVPDVLHRRVLPGGVTIDGHDIPAGTIVGSTQYAVHHNEKYFPRSFDFLPERWIVGSEKLGFPVTASSIELAKRAFIPFSTGSRNCVGKNMAMMELLVATARVAWLLDVRKPEGPLALIGEGGQTAEPGRERKGEFQIENYFLAARDGPVVEFRRREGLVA